MLIADNGVIIRMAAGDINLIGRSTLGVKVMKLREGANIISVATTEHDEEKAEAENPLNPTGLESVPQELTEEEIDYAKQEEKPEV